MISRFSLGTSVVIILLSSIGIAYAYEACVESSSSLGADYCAITACDPIEEIVVIEGENSNSLLGFRTTGSGFQETLSLNYVHTKGTNVVLSISFSCVVSETPIIRCISNDKDLGATSLTGSGTKTGTIAGIILPVGDDGTGTVSFKFQVDKISLGTSVRMSFSVHPLEVSS